MSWGPADNTHGGGATEGAPRQPFALRPDRPRALLIGAAAGIAPTIAVAESLRGALVCAGVAAAARSAASQGSGVASAWKPLVLLGTEQLFPFRPRPSSIIVAGIPTGVIACMPLLEEWGIPCRLASSADLPGCFEGPVTGLADTWLASLGPEELSEVELLVSGPPALLESARQLAARYEVPCQAALW